MGFRLDRFKYQLFSLIRLLVEEFLRPKGMARMFGISTKTLWKWQDGES